MSNCPKCGKQMLNRQNIYIVKDINAVKKVGEEIFCDNKDCKFQQDVKGKRTQVR